MGTPWAAIIGAAFGGALGGISTWDQSLKAQNEISAQRRTAEKAYRYQKDYNDASFYLQRGAALQTLGIQRNRLAAALGADVEGFNLGMEGQALQNQAARVALGDSTGAALAAQGASGTRGSETLQKRIDFHEESYRRQIDLQGRGNSLAVQNMTRQYSNTFNDIGREIDSWNPGGYRMEAKSLRDTYDYQMHRLKLDEFDRATANAEATPLDYFAGILGGASQGASFGMQIDSLREQSNTAEAAQAVAKNTAPAQTSEQPAVQAAQSVVQAAQPIQLPQEGLSEANFKLISKSDAYLAKMVAYGNKMDPENGWASAYQRGLPFEGELYDDLPQLQYIQARLGIKPINWPASTQRAASAGKWPGI